jgi:hypothetical protein
VDTDLTIIKALADLTDAKFHTLMAASNRRSPTACSCGLRALAQDSPAVRSLFYAVVGQLAGSGRKH